MTRPPCFVYRVLLQRPKDTRARAVWTGLSIQDWAAIRHAAERVVFTQRAHEAWRQKHNPGTREELAFGNRLFRAYDAALESWHTVFYPAPPEVTCLKFEAVQVRLHPSDIHRGRTYRGVKPRRTSGLFSDSGLNDRTVLWTNGTVVQYDADHVPNGRHYPKVSMAEFLLWADRDVLEEEGNW